MIKDRPSTMFFPFNTMLAQLLLFGYFILIILSFIVIIYSIISRTTKGNCRKTKGRKNSGRGLSSRRKNRV